MRLIDILVLLSLAVFYLFFLGRIILLYRRGIKVWVVGTSTKNFFETLLENILFPMLALWSALIIISALHLDLTLAEKYLIDMPWMEYAGIAVCYTGLIIFLLALKSFGKAWRIGIDERNSNELITGGIFKYSRNPIFLFMDLYFLGIMLIYPNIVFVIAAVATVIGIHLQILREEKFLRKKFGEKYTAYRRQTFRYLGRRRSS